MQRWLLRQLAESAKKTHLFTQTFTWVLTERFFSLILWITQAKPRMCHTSQPQSPPRPLTSTKPGKCHVPVVKAYPGTVPIILRNMAVILHLTEQVGFFFFFKMWSHIDRPGPCGTLKQMFEKGYIWRGSFKCLVLLGIDPNPCSHSSQLLRLKFGINCVSQSSFSSAF